MNNWVFYYEDKLDGHKTIYAIQKTKAPSRTKYHKQLMSMLDRGTVDLVGSMTAQAWNREQGVNGVTIQE